MLKLFAAGLAVTVALGICAATASAKPHGPYSYTATIDCGSGPVVVGSTDDLFAPLVDLASGRKYRPIAWDVVANGQRIQVSNGKKATKLSGVCSYDDGTAVGTVTVKKA